MAKTYPKGAEWRKWDLHVHTPESVYHQFGSGGDTWGNYIDDLEGLSRDFAVIGVNDYLFLDGYEKLVNEQQANGRVGNLTLLPVVEFRIEKFAGVDFGALKRINLHVIFSNDLSAETIRSQFLNTLEQSYQLEDGSRWTRAITVESVAELGSQIKKSSPEGKRPTGTDLAVGFNNLNVKEEQIYKALEKDCFKGKFLIAVGKTEWADLKWTDASIATKKSIINSADIVFTASETVDDFEKSRAQLVKKEVNNLLLDCSDAHHLSSSSDKDKIGNCLTWLKADPTFNGLKQVLIEPEERIHVGSSPPLLSRVQTNRTKYIKSIRVNQVAGYDSSEGVWFEDVSIPLNSELVAIIGNKGSGKSALADIIALCSNYNDLRDFSFLTNKKFRINSGRIAKNFDAALEWESGITKTLNLNEVSEESEILNVKYIPQGQFERLTNEIATIEEFQKEIEKVVFSHISDDEKLGTDSFDELVKLKTQSVERALEELERKISAASERIISLEAKALPSFKLALEKNLEKKGEELEALAEPEKVDSPAEDEDPESEDSKVRKKVDELKDSIEGLESSIEKQEQEKQKLLKEIQTLSDLESAMKSQVDSLTSYIDEKKSELAEWDIDITKMISVSTDYSEIEKAISSRKDSLKTLRGKLGEEWQELIYGDWPDDASDDQKEELYGQLKQAQYELDLEVKKLSDKEKAYQDYLTKKKAWEKEKSQIVGDPEAPDPGTINQIKNELSYLGEQLEPELKAAVAERENDVRAVFAKKQEVVSVYKTARDQLNAIISRNANTLKDYKISVDASIVPRADFSENFLSRISKNISGSFYNKQDGERRFKEICASRDFDNEDEVIAIVDELTEALHHDKRDGQSNSWRDIRSQAKDVEGLYDYLYSLRFLEYNYQLKQGDKRIEQLSPGERGALLLVFYLLLDKSDIPLVIDQPEDNLDNHSVATVLVPFMRAAKKKRQIIMVTHNPNLAVVSDAEQVIYVGLDKDDNYRFSTVPGSIEDEEVNEKIVDVLEGAMPAFKTRKRKYYDKSS